MYTSSSNSQYQPKPTRQQQQQSTATSTTTPPHHHHQQQHHHQDLTHLFPQFFLPSPKRQFNFPGRPRTTPDGRHYQGNKQRTAATTTNTSAAAASPQLRRVIPPTPQTPIKLVGYLTKRPQWGSNNVTRNQQGSSNTRPSTAPVKDVVPKQQHHHHQQSTTTTRTPRTAPGSTKAKQSTYHKATIPPKFRKNNSTPLNVVLPPRIISASSTSVLEEQEEVEEEQEDAYPKIRITNLHFESTYTPHKSHWIKNALINLGTTWIREGKTTYEQLMSEEFEEKMGVFYDLAMAKKHEAIDRLVDEVVGAGDEVVGGDKERKGSKGRGRKGPVPLKNRVSSTSTATTTKSTSSSTSKLGSSSSSSVQKNFPFAEHLNTTVKASMSDALLRIMTRDDSNNGNDGGGSKKNKSKNNKGNGDEHTNESQSSNNSFERELIRRNKNLVQCYVLDGGKLVIGTKNGLLGVGGSYVNQFGDSKESRVRKSTPAQQQSPNNEQHLGYFRKVANMMGFYPHEVKIRYCKSSNQIVVSGARPQRGEHENARQVREVLELPKNLDVRNLVVLRTTKGSLIFEEIEQREREVQQHYYHQELQGGGMKKKQQKGAARSSSIKSSNVTSNNNNNNNNNNKKSK